MLSLARLTDRPAHGDEIKTHVERTLGGSSAIANTLPDPALPCQAVLRDHPMHVAVVLRANQRGGRRSGARVVQFLTRQSGQDLEWVAFLAQEMRGKTL